MFSFDVNNNNRLLVEYFSGLLIFIMPFVNFFSVVLQIGQPRSPWSPKTALEEVTAQSLLILTDVHKPSICLSKKFAEACNKVAIIDHHRRGEEFIESPVFVYIEPAASSASELVAELIRYNDKRLELSEKVASIMLSGILLDTNYKVVS